MALVYPLVANKIFRALMIPREVSTSEKPSLRGCDETDFTYVFVCRLSPLESATLRRPQTSLYGQNEHAGTLMAPFAPFTRVICRDY